jgi:paraquat-inducible protein B
MQNNIANIQNKLDEISKIIAETVRKLVNEPLNMQKNV